MTTIELPIIENAKAIDSGMLEQIAKTGFFYCKVHDGIYSKLQTIAATAREYFLLPESIKQQSPFTHNHEGYLDHSKSGPTHIERYVYKGATPPEPLLENQTIMDEVRHGLVNDVGMPTLKRIFNYEKIDAHFNDVLGTNESTISIIYYPERKEANPRLKDHTDAVLLTMLYTNEPGLEVFVDDAWRAVDAKHGHIVVNVADSLGIATGGKYKSIRHRVCNLDGENRVSIASFLSPSFDLQLKDYVNDKPLNKTYREYLDDKLKGLYPQ